MNLFRGHGVILEAWTSFKKNVDTMVGDDIQTQFAPTHTACFEGITDNRYLVLIVCTVYYIRIKSMTNI